MPQITSIEPQVKDKTRCSIFVDGVFYCGVKLEVALKYRLKAGMEVDTAQLDAIQLETEKEQAMDKAVAHLSASMKTEREMRDFLSRKGYVPAIADYVLEKLRYYGFVDDGAFCKAYIESVSGKSKLAIEQQLIKRGVPKNIVNDALSSYEDDEEEIFALLQKYMRGKQIDRESLYKGGKYLLSKGYDYDAVKRACDRLNEDNRT